MGVDIHELAEIRPCAWWADSATGRPRTSRTRSSRPVCTAWPTPWAGPRGWTWPRTASPRPAPGVDPRDLGADPATPRRWGWPHEIEMLKWAARGVAMARPRTRWPRPAARSRERVRRRRGDRPAHPAPRSTLTGAGHDL
ncbi:hypothetical protein QJS66_10135 [Kocuria rhizophila]|nr:hypothetical protein QJS66_10135 [Kocuria rhizophila]